MVDFTAPSRSYDDVLDDFLQTNDLDRSDFAARCREALESRGASIDKQVLEAILSATDYRSFVRMMSDARMVADAKAGARPVEFDDRPATPPTAPSSPRERAEGKDAK